MSSPAASPPEDNSASTISSDPQRSSATASPLQSFTGDISPTRVSLLYKAGLAVVAFAMVLLPTIYIALTAWGLFCHVVHNPRILAGCRAVFRAA